MNALVGYLLEPEPHLVVHVGKIRQVVLYRILHSASTVAPLLRRAVLFDIGRVLLPVAPAIYIETSIEFLYRLPAD